MCPTSVLPGEMGLIRGICPQTGEKRRICREIFMTIFIKVLEYYGGLLYNTLINIPEV